MGAIIQVLNIPRWKLYYLKVKDSSLKALISMTCCKPRIKAGTRATSRSKEGFPFKNRRQKWHGNATIMGGVTGRILLCRLQGLGEQSGTVWPPTCAGMKLEMPRPQQKHDTAQAGGDADVRGDPPAAAPRGFPWAQLLLCSLPPPFGCF